MCINKNWGEGPVAAIYERAKHSKLARLSYDSDGPAWEDDVFWLLNRFSWRPIASAPHDGTYVLLRGDTGYITTPYRVMVAHYDAEYRPLQPWVTHSNDSVCDDGSPPTHWMPMPDTESELP